MPVTNPNTLYVGNTGYNLSKVSAWWPHPTIPSSTLVRFDGMESAIIVPLPTADFENAYQNGLSVDLVSAATGVGTSAAVQVSGVSRTYQAVVTGTGAVSAVVAVDVSNNGTDWLQQATITLSGDGYDADGVALEGNWPYVRGNVISIAGTGASVSLSLNVSA